MVITESDKSRFSSCSKVFFFFFFFQRTVSIWVVKQKNTKENELLVKTSAGRILYKAVGQKGRLVVANAATVGGVTGGYIQGGGRLSPFRDMGSDNA